MMFSAIGCADHKCLLLLISCWEKGEAFVNALHVHWRHCEGSSPSKEQRTSEQTNQEGLSPLLISVVTESQMLYEALTQLLPRYTAVTFVRHYAAELCPLHNAPNPAGHIVLVDATMAEQSIVSWIKEWRALTPPATVVTIETGRSGEQILTYIEAGVSGYLLQGATLGQIALALREVSAGRTSCAPELLLRVFERLEDMALDREQGGSAVDCPLTFREQEILAWVEQGYSNREIADELVIAVHTVKHHVHNILEKLHMRRRWEAARFARQQGWLN